MKSSLSKISKIAGDADIYPIAYVLFKLLDNDSKAIQTKYFDIGWGIWIGLIDVQNELTHKIVAIGKECDTDLQLLNMVHQYTKKMIVENSTQLDSYFKIYNREYNFHINVLLYPKISTLYPQLWIQYLEVTKNTLIKDINSASMRLIELKEKFCDWEDSILQRLTEVSSMDKSEQIMTAKLISNFFSTKPDSLIESLKSEFPYVRFLSGASNENGHDIDDIKIHLDQQHLSF